MRYLIESALLTHGLKSITNDEIKNVWDIDERNIAWISQGEIVIGAIDEFLKFRKNAQSYIRINSDTLESALKERISGALTASGTMAVCKRLGVPLAVTCGMGGISDESRICQDLPALVELPVALLTTGPKDMMDRQRTIDWLKEHGVKVYGTRREYCTGYVFSGERIMLQGIFHEKEIHSSMLLIHEIPEEKRIKNRNLLRIAVQEGKCAAKEGKSFHPAVNGKLDDLTEGYSSRIQLESLLENARYARDLQENDCSMILD